MTYEKAIKLLGYNPNASLERNQKRAEFFLSTCTLQCPLKFKAAATFIIRAK